MVRWWLMFIGLAYFGLVLLAMAIPAHGSESCRHHDCNEPQPTLVLHHQQPQKDRLTGDDYLKSVGVSVIIGCGLYAGYQGIKNDRWRWPYQWCLGMGTSREVKPADSGRVTPDNLSDRPVGVRVYQ